MPGKSPLAKAVEHIRDPDLLDFLKVELAALANKVVIADQLSLGEPESLKKAVEKVVGYVQLGLDQVSKNTIEEVIKLLESFPLESIFRLGFTLVKRLKIRAKKIVTEGWISKWPHKMLILPTPYQSLLEALMLPDPQCLEISQDGTLEIKAFSSLDKILWTGDKLSEIECLGDIYWGLDVDYVKIVEKLWPLGQPGEPTEIKIDDLIITAVANKIITGKIEYLPIPSPRIPEVIRTVQQSSEDSLVADFISKFHFSSPESQESNTFYVKELVDLESIGFNKYKGAYILIEIYKRGLTTPEAIQRISRKLRIPCSNISYAGLKDKKSTSIQYATIKSQLLPFKTYRIGESLLEEDNLKVTIIGYTLKKLKRKNLYTYRSYRKR